nr:MAG TPA_asm: hypothetical protein [Caudoviricetes sp.]
MGPLRLRKRFQGTDCFLELKSKEYYFRRNQP